ncbi:MAG: discoidin domain-containing protein [Planctomycetota bacterium]
MKRFFFLFLIASCCLGRAWCPADETSKPIPVQSITASQDMPTKYAADKAIDGNDQTHWAAHSAPPQWIRIDFAQQETVDAIRILGVSARNIYDNWRRVNVSFSDGGSFAVTLADESAWHTITFPARQVSWIKLTIESTYKRTHYIGCEEIQAMYVRHDAKEPTVTPKADAQAADAQAESDAWQPTESDRKHIARLAEKSPVDANHPTLWITSEDVERAKRNTRTHPWAFDWYCSTLRVADEWAARSDEEICRLVPQKHAVFDKLGKCPKCRKPLTAGFERVGKAYCPACETVFPNDEYPDNGQGWKDPKTGKMVYFVGMYNERAIYALDDALRALADAYMLTGEDNFARAASVIFDGIAVIYPTCDKGPKWYPGVGGRLNRPFYQTARTLIYYCDQYDMLHLSPEWEKPSVDPNYKTRRANVEENFLRNGGQYCFDEIHRYEKTKSLNNGFCDYLQGAVAAGRILGIQKFLDYALDSELSVFNFVENTIDRDGQYFETAFMYSSHAIDLFSHHAEMLRTYRSEKFPNGINLYDHPKLKLAFLRMERDIECAGHVPPLGDTGPDVSVIAKEERQGVNPYVYRRLEYLAARAADPKERQDYAERIHAYVGDVEKARGKHGLARWLAFNGAEIAPSAQPPGGLKPPGGSPTSSTLLPGSRGISILRTGQDGDTAALLRWGPTLNHGSPDEMNLNFFAIGREVTYDPGYLWAHCRAGWTHATGSHNLVAVNEKNQLGQPGGGGDLVRWFEAPGVCAVSADDPLCYGTEGVSRYQRSLVLMDLTPTQHYLLDIFRVAGGQTHDLNWHFFGEMKPATDLKLPPPQTTGSLAGPEYEWWKLLQPDGWLEGIKEGFYWRAPPGNGYGFIFNLQRIKPSGPCAFDWTFGKRLPEPRWLFDPGRYVGQTSGKVHKPLSLGSYFYHGEEDGDFIEFTLPVEKEGEYLVLTQFYKSSHYGIVQAAMDGQPLGKPINTYSPTSYFADPVALGAHRLAPGEHRLRFTVVGKDSESKGRFFSIKYLAFESPDFLEDLQKPKAEIVRLHLLPAPDTELIVGRAKSTSTFPEATYVISRRKGDGLSTQFVSVAEPSVGPPEVATIDRMQPAGAAGAEDVAALRIATRSGRLDYVFESTHPSESKAYVRGNETVTFGGTFGIVRTQDGKPMLLALHGPGVLEFAGQRLDGQSEATGAVTEVDVDGCAIYTNAKLPEQGLEGCVIQFSNPAYSRRSPFLISRVVREKERTRIELDAASLIMARGLVGEEKAGPGVIANLVPLDRERMVLRGFRTMYFQGKRIAADDGSDWGRVKDVSVTDWRVTSTQPVEPRPGMRFSIIELSPGDQFSIQRTTTMNLKR